MHLDQVVKRLNRLAEQGHTVQFGPPASDLSIERTQRRLGLQFPEPVCRYWKAFDGLFIDKPKFEVFALDALKKNSGLLHFATLSGETELAFRTESLNEAGQWSIVFLETNQQLTFTLQSFWSIHIWNWLERGKMAPPVTVY